MTESNTRPPAAFVDLYESVELQIGSVIDGAAPLNVAGDVITEIFTFIDDVEGDAILESIVQQAEEIGRLKRALAGHLFDGESLSTREAVRSELIEQGFKRTEQHAALEEIAHAQQEQLAAAARQSSTYQRSVIERDEQIAEQRRLLRSQNEIINGLHEQRRKQVSELNVAVITLFETMHVSSVDVNDETLQRIAERTTGAHYALTVTRHPDTMTTRFEVTNIKGQIA